jgi:threonine aldolase
MRRATSVIDLRSDTVTRPTAGMRAAMATAEVGDDVFGEDPTVRRLEERVAELLGKEAALFVPSGTMSNQICIKVHTQPGDELICDVNSHVYNYEAGGPAVLSGVMCRTIEGERGIFDVQHLEGLVRPDNDHLVRTRLVCIENTHNRGGGSIFPWRRFAVFLIGHTATIWSCTLTEHDCGMLLSRLAFRFGTGPNLAILSRSVSARDSVLR